jgi:hypothetical protein
VFPRQSSLHALAEASVLGGESNSLACSLSVSVSVSVFSLYVSLYLYSVSLALALALALSLSLSLSLSICGLASESVNALGAQAIWVGPSNQFTHPLGADVGYAMVIF